jgi:mono/diheme cytochrome c family protein
MSRRTPVLIVAVASLWVAAFAASSAQQLGPGERSVWDGVYTAAQAVRGKPKFEAGCGRCHNNGLAGSTRGPALKGNDFWSHFQSQTLADLFVYMRDRMPRDSGGSVSDDQKVDILAYVLSVSGMPPGPNELTLDLRAMESIKVAKKTTLDGVFTAAQAERGRSHFVNGCASCHRPDLGGERGPTLKGEAFLAHWENGSVHSLFDKIRDTMPATGPSDVTDEAKADILAFLLQSNGFPAGTTELRAEAEALGVIDIVRQGQRTSIPNFSLVQVVGCLTPGANNGWVLANSNEPAFTADEEPTAAALETAQGTPLGTQTFQLLSVEGFAPDGRKGQKVEARGLLYKDANYARLNLTSLQTLQTSCPR